MADIPVRADAVVVYALRMGDAGHEVLLLKRDKGDGLDAHWLHIAGKIEDNEKAWQTGLRELEEETGLVPLSFYSANYCEQFYSALSDTVHILPLFVAFIDRTQDVVLNHEHKAFIWMPVAAALETLPFANQKACLAHIEKNFIDAVPPDYLKIA